MKKNKSTTWTEREIEIRGKWSIVPQGLEQPRTINHLLNSNRVKFKQFCICRYIYISLYVNCLKIKLLGIRHPFNWDLVSIKIHENKFSTHCDSVTTSTESQRFVGLQRFISFWRLLVFMFIITIRNNSTPKYCALVALTFNSIYTFDKNSLEKPTKLFNCFYLHSGNN